MRTDPKNNTKKNQGAQSYDSNKRQNRMIGGSVDGKVQTTSIGGIENALKRSN